VKFAEKSAEPPLEDLYKYTYVDDGEAGVSPANARRTTAAARKQERAANGVRNNGDAADTAAATPRKK
jgi:hypothetical protein